METWVSLDRALELASEHGLAAPPAAVEVSLDEALHRILAAHVASRIDDPAFTNSSMDGFALRVADAPAATESAPAILPVTLDIPAGSDPDLPELPPGQAARIMTGAPLPPGADAILPLELTAGAEPPASAPSPPGTLEWIALHEPPKPHFVRQRAENLRIGQVALPAGTWLDAAHVGLAATMGHATLPVQTPVRMAILSTGDELIPAGSEPAPGRIYESNSHGLAASIRAIGHASIRLHAAADTDESVRALLDEAGARAEVIVTSGGASVGDHDVMRRLLHEEGTVHYWRVSIRPGNPVLFAHWKDTPLFALPGNPVSSMLVFRVLVRPWLQRVTGTDGPGEQRVVARLRDPVKGTKDRLTMRRVLVTMGAEGLEATVKTHQGSGNLHSMVAGNAVTWLPPGMWGEPGDLVECLLL